MNNQRWFNPHQPQTLQTAVILLYLNAAFALLFGLLTGSGIVSILTVAGAVGAFGIANEKKWGYTLALVAAIIPAATHALDFIGIQIPLAGSATIITLMFEIALVVLLLHPMSRQYQRIWFK